MRVLIVAPFVHHLVRPADRAHRFGGTEVRALTLARHLAAQGFDVTLGISAAHSTPPQDVAGIPCRVGVTYPTAWQGLVADASAQVRWHPGPAVHKGPLPRPVAIAVRAVSATKRRWGPPAPPLVRFHWGRPDAVIAFSCHGFSVGALLDAAHDARVFAALSLVNDSDLEPNDTQSPAHHKALALDAADLCLVQTKTQADVCVRRGYAAEVVKNPVPDLGLSAADRPPPSGPYVLWVGRDTAQKRLDRAVALAQSLPTVSFRFVIDEPVPHLQTLSVPSNVVVQGATSFSETAQLIAHARLLLNTSAHEGFPNTFLQAAQAGVPVVSLEVDPGDMLTTHGAGVCAHNNAAALPDEVQALFDDAARRRSLGRAGQAYVAAQHDPTEVGRRLAAVIEAGVAQKRAETLTGRARLDDEPATSRVHYARGQLRRAYARTVPAVLAGRTDLDVLDFGAGHSPYRALFAPFAKQYHSADLDNPEADLAIGPDGRVPLPDHGTDVVVSSQVLEHVPSPRAYLDEAHRLLRPQGTLLLSTHGTWPLHHDPLDLWRWTPDGLCTLLEQQGFVVDDLIPIQGMAATGLQLVQDALATRLPGRARAFLYAPTQLAMRVFDAVTPSRLSRSNAAVFLVIAHAEPR